MLRVGLMIRSLWPVLAKNVCIYTVAMNAEIRMQSATAAVSEGMMSTMVCAIISGVTGVVEEAVDATLALTGSTKAGTFAKSILPLLIVNATLLISLSI